MSTWVGIDVGGTFTDVVVYTDNGTRMTTAKVASTPDDPSEAFMNGLRLGLENAGAAPSTVTRLVHGSTVGVNAFLQKRGARVGVICTQGFEDTLAIGRAKRKQMYEFMLDYQTPGFLAERSNTVGIRTRLDAQGKIVEEATPDAIDEAIRHLIEGQGVESIAVNLLFSYTNPAVEKSIADRIATTYPHVYVSRASAIDPRLREYERLVVTALDAYIRPLIVGYVSQLKEKVKNAGVPAPLYLMESHGGVVDMTQLQEKAVSVLMSGLAGGAMGAAKVGTVLNRGNLLSVDMGGTSTDVTLITNGNVAVSDEGTVGDYDVRLPTVDVHTVGAGGGSIAKVDVAGGLKVGPHSAGATPGPACYDQGGSHPTVTDANVLLGYLPGEELANGTLSLRRDLAMNAVQQHVATPTGMEVAEAAWAVHQVAVASMANAARVVSIRRGIDVRDYALFPCGGAGPMHACDIADELGIEDIVIAPTPGVLAAYGLLSADTVTNTWRTSHSGFDMTSLNSLYQDLLKAIDEAEAETSAKGPDTSRIATEVSLDMRYVGQSHELDVEIEPEELLLSGADQRLRKKFDALHLERYGQNDRQSSTEITGYKVTVTGYREIPAPGFEKTRDSDSTHSVTDFYDPTRKAFVQAPVLSRSGVNVDIKGPAILEQPDSTIVIQRGWRASSLPHGALYLTKESTLHQVQENSLVSIME